MRSAERTLPIIPSNPARAQPHPHYNPFFHYDKTIISIDTLKSDAEYRTYSERASWDIIVSDEAHNVADRGTQFLRSRLARLLARRSDSLIMLSATPHDGRAKSFTGLVNMLDAAAIADPEDYTAEDLRPSLVIHRFKKDIQDEWPPEGRGPDCPPARRSPPARTAATTC